MNKSKAQEFMSEISGKNIIDNDFKIIRDDQYVYFPIQEGNSGPWETVMKLPEKNQKKPSPKGHSGAFDVIGDIAVIRERKDGSVDNIVEFIARTRKSIRTIYLDHGVSGELRLRDLELLYGEDNPETLHRENGIILWVNIKKAYFSPRLATERMIIASRVKEGERILDMFCGIGSFTITIMKNHTVEMTAFDKNPDAIAALEINIKRNKVGGLISTHICDSWEGIKTMSNLDRIIMNNPTSRHVDLISIGNALKDRGIVNFYEINDVEGIAERMKLFNEEGFETMNKRIVHGYSKNSSMVSLEFRKVN
ncbi:MAG: class I SAM-dependent methyltransferase [Thermoplasmataceae archaeon]